MGTLVCVVVGLLAGVVYTTASFASRALAVGIVDTELRNAEMTLAKYEAEYIAAVNFAADNYRLSNRVVERHLVEIYTILGEKQQILRECRELTPQELRRAAIRNHVIAALTELSEKRRQSADRSWQNEIEERVALIFRHFNDQRTAIAAGMVMLLS